MPSSSPPPTDYTSCSHSDLISRITHLETQLRLACQIHYQPSRSPIPSSPRPSSPTTKSSRRDRSSTPFNPSKYSTRHIALKFAYLGASYNGFEHANGTLTPKPTVEEVLWCGLRKARLISPPSVSKANGSPSRDAGASGEPSMEVLWDTQERLQRGPIDLNWDGCQYSKCGRTDRGVSAFGQVVGVRVRSNRPLSSKNDPVNGIEEAHEVNGHVHTNGETMLDADAASDGLPEIDVDDLTSDDHTSAFHPVNDEISYISILNSILPPTIRILAWCPSPPPDFDARFSCRERRYRYFFTNPSFLPTPGPLGLQGIDGKKNGFREGWLDIDKMSQAAKKLEGLHDFRNLCKIDASKLMPSCERRITYAAIEEQQRGPVSPTRMPQLHCDDAEVLDEKAERAVGPQVFSFTVHGSAFLWHQVRCMAAILFLVGQGLEQPSVVDELLDVERNPGKPMYEMASDAPLVLWDCVFPDENNGSGEDALDWIYAGDASSIPALTIKSDGKFGMGGVVDEVWTQWRKAKMDEILASSLLDLVIGQGDGSALSRGGFRDMKYAQDRSQKIFDGRETPRMAGKYVSVMQKPKMDSLEAQNEKYRAGKGTRRGLKRNGPQEVSSEDR